MEFDFATNVTVDTLAKVPADFQSLYVEAKDGDKTVFKLASDDPKVKSSVAAITGLNNALKSARAEVKAAKGTQIDLTPLADYGTDPTSIAAKVKETIEGLHGQIKGVDVNKIKLDLEKPWTEKLTKAEQRAQAAEKSFHSRVVVGDAKSAIASFKADELLLPFVLSDCKIVTDEQGNLDVVIKDDAGAIRYSGVTGKPMTVLERVTEMKGIEKFMKLFPSEAPRGGGAAPNGSPRPGIRTTINTNPGEKSATSKIAAGLAAGFASKK